MTKQKKWSDMDTETRAHARDMMRRFEQSVCSEATSARARRGILKMRDPFGAPRRLHLHQVVAAQRLLLKHRETPWEQRKSALLAIHDLGLGKTITAVLAIAKVLNKCPDPDAAKVVVLCPLAVLSAWDDALRTWTTLGDRVLVGHRQAQLTEAAIEAAQVVLTTPDVLMAAFKTFVYQGASEEDRKKPKMQRFHHGVAPSDATRREQLQGALPPIHPMFALLTRRAPALALTVVDELHRCCNPTTITGHVVAMFCADSVYTLGLTGTPVTSQPKQMAHLAKALNAQPPKLQQPAFLVEARNARVLNEAAIAEYHARLVDRVKADVLNLPPKRYALLEYDPWVGPRAPTASTDAGGRRWRTTRCSRAAQEGGGRQRGGGARAGAGQVGRARARRLRRRRSPSATTSFAACWGCTAPPGSRATRRCTTRPLRRRASASGSSCACCAAGRRRGTRASWCTRSA